MALFGGTILTNLGKQAIAQSLTGKQFEITKVVLGDGVWDENTNPEELTSLISPKLTLPIADKEEYGDTVRIRVLLTNEGVTEGFFIRELGVIAEDTTGEEILYAVAYADPPDYLPAGDGPTKVEAGFDVIVVVANSPNITVRVSDTIVLATKQDIETHNQSPEAHPDIRQAIQNLEEQISNIGKGITPDIQAAIEQHNQDPDAHPELLLKFIWRKETRNPTPDDVPPYENALWLNLESGEIFVHLKTCNGKTFWKGQFGTLITPSTVSVFDIFGDGSAVALYRFDGSPADDGGQYNGTWYGTEQYDMGVFGQAAKFDGSSYINFGDFDNIFSQKSYTVSGWIKGTGTFLNIRNLNADASSNDCKGGLTWVESDGTLRFFVKGSGDSSQLEKTTILTLDDSHLLTIVHNVELKKVELFIDTELNFSIQYSGDLIFKDGITGLLGVHHYKNTYNYYFRGFIDQVRVFNRALDEREIQILYNEMEVNC